MVAASRRTPYCRGALRRCKNDGRGAQNNRRHMRHVFTGTSHKLGTRSHGPKNKPKKTGDMRYVFTGFEHKSVNPAPWDRRGSKKTPPRSVQAYGNRPKAIPDAWGKRRGHGNATWGVRQRSSKSRSSLPGDMRGNATKKNCRQGNCRQTVGRGTLGVTRKFY